MLSCFDERLIEKPCSHTLDGDGQSLLSVIGHSPLECSGDITSVYRFLPILEDGSDVSISSHDVLSGRAFSLDLKADLVGARLQLIEFLEPP